jgi:hypothetical protein
MIDAAVTGAMTDAVAPAGAAADAVGPAGAVEVLAAAGQVGAAERVAVASSASPGVTRCRRPAPGGCCIERRAIPTIRATSDGDRAAGADLAPAAVVVPAAARAVLVAPVAAAARAVVVAPVAAAARAAVVVPAVAGAVPVEDLALAGRGAVPAGRVAVPVGQVAVPLVVVPLSPDPQNWTSLRRVVLMVVVLACAGCGARSGLVSLSTDAGRDASLPTCTPGPPPTLTGVTRAVVQPHISSGEVIDPDDDLLLVIGGLSASGVFAEWIDAVALSTGVVTRLTVVGDAALGPDSRAVWDTANHRAVVVGGVIETSIKHTNPKQVFAIEVRSGQAHVSLLPDFPGKRTGIMGIAYDPAAPRLLVADYALSGESQASTYALDLTKGKERWSVLAPQPSEMVVIAGTMSGAYDRLRRRMIVVTGVTKPPALHRVWALALDPLGSWTPLAGLPDDLAAVNFPLLWDERACAFVAVVSASGTCAYHGWRLVPGDTIVATPLGVLPQTSPRSARYAAGYDTVRQRVVFGAGFSCDSVGTLPNESSIDFVSLAHP